MIIQKQAIGTNDQLQMVINITGSINVEQVMDDFALIGTEATYLKLGKLFANELMFGGLLRESSAAVKH